MDGEKKEKELHAACTFAIGAQMCRSEKPFLLLMRLEKRATNGEKYTSFTTTICVCVCGVCLC